VREWLIHGLIQGDRGTWAALGVLWALTALLVLLHRPGGWQQAPGSRAGRAGPAFTWALLSMTTATSLAGLPLASALAVPRLRWRLADAAELVNPSGETWRRLRGPWVAVPGAEPDLAIPTIDAADKWVLVELLSGKPVPGLPPAEAAPAAPGATRLCPADGAPGCRAWPVAWPDPARSHAQSELTWARSVPGGPETALAYDVETGLYLVHVEPPAGRDAAPAGEATHLEVVGRLGADPAREGTSVLFVARRIAGGRLRAARVAATMGDGTKPGHAFHLQRADVSLRAGPRVFAWVARPVLAVTSFALPLGILVHLLAPLVLRARRREETDALTGKALRQQAAALVGPWLEAVAAFTAGLAAAAPAAVAIASLWGSR
jgi:hypothetical protein